VENVAQPSVQTFGKYQILERIATGGMAEIYKARLEGIGGFQRTFAIKRILPHLSQNADYVAMLVDEAKVAGLLSHANIVQILDLGQVDAVWYIAMEYVAGRDLGAVLKRCGVRGLRLPVPHTVFVAIELLKGLEYAHQRQVMRGGRPVPLNIIHRDVSPPNILLSFQGEVKLTDFGIARASLKVMETQAGVIKGRFDYMSPEQASGSKDLDQRSDLFSVGVVLYEMLTGAHPFRADSELTTLESVRVGRYEPISSINPDVPFTLEAIVDRALRVDRADRYPSATAFKEALDKFFHDAGFIFTHSTLAAYVKGLFPEIEQGTAAQAQLDEIPVADEDARPTDAITDEVELEGGEEPTYLMDRKVVEDELARQAAQNAHFGLKPSEESTQIRRNPLLHLSAEWADEQETVVRDNKSFSPAPLDGPPTVIEDHNEAMGEISTLLRRKPETPPVRPARAMRPGRLGVLVAGLGAVLLAFGALLGGAVGVAWGQLMNPPEVAAPAQTGWLRLQAPAGAVVMVNGEAALGEVAVAAGTPHRVRIELDGHQAWEQEITLGAGELRVLVFTATALTPQDVAVGTHDEAQEKPE
jgi:serine/threonine protein kinase